LWLGNVKDNYYVVGYTGTDCSVTATTSTTLNYSPALLGLSITLFIIIFLLIGAVVLLIRQVAAYKEDVTHYQVRTLG
jgi:hypothetical protein